MTKLSVISFVHTLFRLYSWLLVARIVISWFQVDPYNPLVRFIARLTDPVLRWFQGLLPPMGMVDFSPVLAFFALRIVHTVVIELLWRVWP